MRFDGPILHYVLTDDHQVVAEPDIVTWGRWFQTADRVVQRDGDEESGWWVSTVFIGLDHNFTAHGPPILFESLVFAGTPLTPWFTEKWDGYMVRYATWPEALAGHAAILAAIAPDLEVAKAAAAAPRKETSR